MSEMTGSSPNDNRPAPRNAASWARPVGRLKVQGIPEGAINLNVEGRQVVGPLQGFGQLWQKTYKVRLTDPELSPQAVLKVWKEHLPEFMPADSRFYPSVTGVQPGEVVLINATLPGVPGTISTGVLVLYADDDSFSVMTPEGHPESGFNTFSAYEEGDATVVQIQSLARANDPIYEFGFRFMGGAAQQERIWHHVLTSLAAHFGAAAEVQMVKQCVDPRWQWKQAGNVWHNAMIRSTLAAPGRLLRRLGRSA